MKKTFYCPHCQAQLTKSAQAYVLGEMLSNKQASFVAFGDAENLPPVVCPACGRAIDSNAMVAGRYDERRGSDRSLTLVAWIVVLVILMAGFKLSFWVAATSVLLAALAFEVFRYLVTRPPSGPKD